MQVLSLTARAQEGLTKPKLASECGGETPGVETSRHHDKDLKSNDGCEGRLTGARGGAGWAAGAAIGQPFRLPALSSRWLNIPATRATGGEAPRIHSCTRDVIPPGSPRLPRSIPRPSLRPIQILLNRRAEGPPVLAKLTRERVRHRSSRSRAKPSRLRQIGRHRAR
jgi:hypothetical protein